MGTSMVARTRAKQGRSHRRSTVRLRMMPSVVVLRQLSKVMGGTGAEVGGTVSWVSWLPQVLHWQVFPATWAKLVMVTMRLSSCSCCMALSYTRLTCTQTFSFRPSMALPAIMPGQQEGFAFL